MQGALEAARHALTLDTTNAENRSLALRLRSQVERKNGGSCGDLTNSDGAVAAQSATPADLPPPRRISDGRRVRVGDWILVEGLQTATQHNGRAGQITGAQGNRFQVRLLNGPQVALKPANLRLGCQMLTYEPESGHGDNVLVLLHGLGDTPDKFLALGKQLNFPSTSVVALRAPWPVGCGGPLEGQVGGGEWFPAFEDNGDLICAQPADKRRLQGLNAAVKVVQDMLECLWREHAQWSARTTVVIGFSQGAQVAVALGLTCTLAAVVGVSGSALEEVAMSDGADDGAVYHGRGETPMLLSHGLRDCSVKIETARKCCAQVQRRLGADLVMWREYDKGHEMFALEEEVRDLMSFMAKHLTLRGPLAGENGAGRDGTSGFGTRDDVVEITDASVIRKIIMGGGGGGDIHVHQDSSPIATSEIPPSNQLNCDEFTR